MSVSIRTSTWTPGSSSRGSQVNLTAQADDVWVCLCVHWGASFQWCKYDGVDVTSQVISDLSNYVHWFVVEPGDSNNHTFEGEWDNGVHEFTQIWALSGAAPAVVDYGASSTWGREWAYATMDTRLGGMIVGGAMTGADNYDESYFSNFTQTNRWESPLWPWPDQHQGYLVPDGLTETIGHGYAQGDGSWVFGLSIGPPVAGGGGIMVIAERWKQFLRELREALIPPELLLRRYREAVQI